MYIDKSRGNLSGYQTMYTTDVSGIVPALAALMPACLP